MDSYAITAIVWTCVALFVITGVITLLALLNVVQLGGNAAAHNYYLKALFRTLVAEIVVISVGAFGVQIKNYLTENGSFVLTTIQNHEARIRLLELEKNSLPK